MDSGDYTQGFDLQWPIEFISSVDAMGSASSELCFGDFLPQDPSVATDPATLLLPSNLLSNDRSSIYSSSSPRICSSSPAPQQSNNESASETQVVKLKPGRKRKGDMVDRDVLRRERMIRNRLAAQRSREKKRKESQSVEQENEQLKNLNQKLEERVQTLESSNQLLLQQLANLSNQMMIIQSQFQSTSGLYNGFGETAELTVGGLYRSLSQQRKPLDWLVVNQTLLTLESIRLFLFLWWSIHHLVTDLTLLGIVLVSSPLNKFIILPSHSTTSSVSFTDNGPPYLTRDLTSELHLKWFPPGKD